MHHPTTADRASPHPETRRPARGLVVLLATLAGSSGALWMLAGPPAIPYLAGWPGLDRVLTGSAVEETWLVALAAATAWLLIAYVAAIVLLRATLLALQSLAGGARWVRTGLWLSDLVTVPALRRVVDGGIAGVLLVSGSLSLPARALASPPTVSAMAPGSWPVPVLVDKPASGHTAQRVSASQLEYTVVPGDSLWAIADRFYGDGTRYVEIVAANRSLLSDPGVIEPGWTIRIPLPVAGIEVTDVARYRVAAGDDLWSLAARFLGDGFRWPEIFALNRDRVMSDGRAFTDANAITPGWVLELPLAVRPVSPPPALASPGPAPATPLPTATPGRPTPTPVTLTPAPTPASVNPGAAPAPATGAEPAPVTTAGRGPWGAAVVTAAGFVVLGGAIVFVHRRRRGGVLPASPGPTPEPPVGDAGRVTAAARALAGALAALGMPQAPVFLHETQHGIAVTFTAAPGLGDALTTRQRELAHTLDCDVRVDRDAQAIRVTLTGFRHLAAALQPVSEPRPLIVPVGADREGIVYADLRALGGVALAVPPEAQRRLVRAWGATLVTTHAAEDLALRADRLASDWLEELTDAPHFLAIGGPPGADQLLTELAELIDERRLDAGAARHGETVLALVGEAADAGVTQDVMKRGPGVDVIVVAPDGEAPERARIRLPRPDEPDAGVPVELVLEIPGLERLPLEWVHVRRDQSVRWASPDRPVPVPQMVTATPEPSGAVVEEQQEADPVAELPAAVPAGAASMPPAGTSTVPEPPPPDGPIPGTASPDRSRFAETPPPEPAPARRRARTRAAAVRGAPRTTTPVAEAGVPEAPTPAPPVADASVPESPAPTPPVAEASVPDTPAPVPPLAAASVPDTPPPVPPDDRSSRQMAMFAGNAAGPAAAATTDGVVAVYCFGGLEILVAGEPLGDWAYHKAPELLAFMVAQGRSVGREQIASALWPDLPWDRHVGHSLSNVVSYLRRRLREATGRADLRVMRSTRQGRYELDRSLFETDLDGFELALRRAASVPPELALDEYDRALALYTGEFLAGLPLEWADGYRTEYRERFRAAAQKAAALAQRQGAIERSIGYHRLVLGQEPTDEVAARGLMEALAATGDLTGARWVYRDLGDAIQQLLDDPRAAPDPETRALLSRLIESAQEA